MINPKKKKKKISNEKMLDSVFKNLKFLLRRKLIGARFYNQSDIAVSKLHTPRDTIGHGTHVASTAAGGTVASASYYGLAAGTAKGGSTGSRIAVYRVCSWSGCRGSSILSAFDDAIADGVDVLSLSLGAGDRTGKRSDCDWIVSRGGPWDRRGLLCRK
jgi:subtilisin family serine protease